MTLTEAYPLVQVVPSNADVELGGRIEEASGIILTELQRLARRIRVCSDLGEDPVSDAMLKLIKNGPADPLPNDEIVRAWLCTMLRNRCIDIRRRREREQRWQVGGKHVGPQPEATRKSSTQPADAETRARLRALADGLTPALRSAVAELMAIASGERTFDTVVEGELQKDELPRAGAGEADLKRVRNRKYKQYQRALAALHSAIDANEPSIWEREKLHRAADGLRLSIS